MKVWDILGQKKCATFTGNASPFYNEKQFITKVKIIFKRNFIYRKMKVVLKFHSTLTGGVDDKIKNLKPLNKL